MRRHGLMLLSCGFALALASCGKDEMPPSLDAAAFDQGVYPDTQLGGRDQAVGGVDQRALADGALTHDQSAPAGDGHVALKDSGAPLSCGQVGLCSEACGKKCTGIVKIGCLMTCNTTCRAQGCASAKPLFDTLTECIQSKCLAECGGGPSAKCTTCTTTKCAKQTTDCNANKC